MKILIYAGYKNHPSSEEGKKEKKRCVMIACVRHETVPRIEDH
jgi:hypothetical protein